MKQFRLLTEKLFSVCSVFAWSYIVFFYSFVFRTICKIGFVPSYGHPDPALLGFKNHTKLVDVTLLFSLICIFVGLLLLILLNIMGISPKRKMLLLFWCAVWVSICHLLADPLFAWYAD